MAVTDTNNTFTAIVKELTRQNSVKEEIETRCDNIKAHVEYTAPIAGLGALLVARNIISEEEYLLYKVAAINGAYSYIREQYVMSKDELTKDPKYSVALQKRNEKIINGMIAQLDKFILENTITNEELQ